MGGAREEEEVVVGGGDGWMHACNRADIHVEVMERRVRMRRDVSMHTHCGEELPGPGLFTPSDSWWRTWAKTHTTTGVRPGDASVR